jgi:hypothetical protein
MNDFAEVDFEDFKAFLLDKNITSEQWLVDNLNELRKLHTITLSLIIWDHTFRSRSPHQKYFLKETRSDCIHSLFAVFTGCRKAANLLLRGVIENVLRHLYYFDHPIEFQLIGQNDEYLQLKDLMQYIRKHPALYKTVEETACVLDELEQTYKMASKFVHAQNLRFMQLSKALSEIAFDQRFFEWYVRKFGRVASHLNLLLILLHYEDFKAMNRDYKKVILKTMSKSNKKALSKL